MGIAIFQDVKTNGTNGGASSSGVQTRDLNTVQFNTIAGASLSSNQITLPAGDFLIEATVPAYQVSRHQAKIVNTTSNVEYLGSNASAGTGIQTVSVISVVVTTAANDVLEIQHYTQSASTTGLGLACTASTDEVYTQVKVTQL